MDSYRLVINNYDLSTSNIENATSCVGYTVIKAPKGPIKPVRIPQGGDAKIQDIFGVASKDFPEIYEATEFNRFYDLYISAPYNGASVPVAFITTKGIFTSASNMKYNDGVEEYVSGLINSTEFIPVFEENNKACLASVSLPKSYWNMGENRTGSDVSIVKLEEEKLALLIDTGLTLEQLKDENKFSALRLSNLPKDSIVDLDRVNYKIQDENSKDVGYFAYKNGTEYKEITEGNAEGNAGEKTIFIVINGNESATLNPTYISDYFSNNQISTINDVKAFWKISIDSNDDKSYLKESDIKGYIFPKYPSSRPLHISFEAFNKNKGYNSSIPASRNILKMSVYEEGAFHNAAQPVSVVGSLDSTATDANGKYIGFTSANEDIEGQNLVFVHSIDGKGFTNNDPLLPGTSEGEDIQYPSIVLEGGVRDTEIGEAEAEEGKDIHDRGWNEAQNEDYSVVNIFFDSQKHDGVTSDPSSIFRGLSEYHPLAGFMFNKTVAPGEVLNSDKTISLNTPLSYGPNYWNSTNEANIELPNHDVILSPLQGIKAAMQCRIIENRWGGIAPMYLNSGTPAMGGQISPTGLKNLRYRYTKDQQKVLDDMNYNPIISDHSYGVMSVGQKTCKEGAITDWSYIGHVCAFLDFQREVRENVMIPQLGKANNPYYRTLRREQVLQLLSKRLSGNNRIWAEASVDTSTADGVNDIQAQKARKFIINVKVKVDVFSEFVTLNFINIDQSMTV